MTPQDIQGNSWTDEPEIPNTKREAGKQMPMPVPNPDVELSTPDEEQGSLQPVPRPPADS